MMQMNERAAHYWGAFINEKPFPDGLAFDKALKQAKLDFSLKSLDRIDQLLNQIRTRLKPEIEVFLAKPECQDFVFLLGFYLGMVAAKHSKIPLRWLEYEELAGLYPSARQEYPRCFGTSVSCVMGNSSFFLPLAVVLERLFHPVQGRTVHSMTAHYIEPALVNLALREPGPGEVAPDLLPYAVSMKMAGFMCAIAVADLANGASIMPATCTHFPDGRLVMKRLLLETMHEAVAAGQHDMQNNPEQGLAMALLFDASLKLFDGPYDALVIDIRTYAPHPFGITLALPYRSKNSERGFAVHELKIIDSNASPAFLERLIEQFFIGVYQEATTSAQWARHLDESI